MQTEEPQGTPRLLFFPWGEFWYRKRPGGIEIKLKSRKGFGIRPRSKGTVQEAMSRQLKVASHSYGAPERPKALPRATRNAWKALVEEYLAARVLRQDDAPILLELIQARADQYKAAGPRRAEAKARAEELHAAFTARVSEPESSAVAVDTPVEASIRPLAEFLGDIRAVRASFQLRRGDDTVCRADGGLYDWPETGFPARARRYAEARRDDEEGAGALLRLACGRFLRDLETGASKGFWFDPLEADLICQFAETYCGITLLDWEIFILVNLAFKRVHGERRYTEFWISTAKKSGKTALAAIVALWGLLCDQEKFPDVFSIATKRDQAKLVWRDARRMVGNNTELIAHVKKLAGHLEAIDTEGCFTPLSSDEKSMDGLRPSFIIADEVAFWESRDLWDTVVKGLVSRESPLVFAITTAGKDRYSFCYGKFDLAEKILNGTFIDDGTFVAVFRIDPDDDYIDDESCWIKANPSLGVTVKIEHLRKTRDEVKQDGTGRNSFLQLHMNIWPANTLRRTGSIPREKWQSSSGLSLIGNLPPDKAYKKFVNLNLDNLCFVGLDIGLVSDFTAIAYLWDHFYLEADQVDATGKVIVEAPLITDKRAVICEFFCPEEGLLDKERAFRAPLSVWVREGWLKLLPGDCIDTRDITQHILETARLQSIQELGFDKWNAMQIGADLNATTAIKCVEVPQTQAHLTNPCRELLNLVRRGDLYHFSNPMLSWCISNVILQENEKTGGIKPEKLSAIEKIDGVSALVNSLSRQLAAPPRFSGKIYTI